ncbi:Reticulocyte-binding protein 2-like protein a [Zootermopsis nevadensis]|uniref:Reticulocyte-binding protein 2-like protein a n=1 Tax=Zootermopsis nevadensis TaxID=136037 RepID=A0A067RDZ5_ZOONE|nr:Reticulocyte-binding protein 2-like protein a [Zootermopsis nevadensis]
MYSSYNKRRLHTKLTNVQVEWLTLLLGLEIGYPDRGVRGFPQPLQEKFRDVRLSHRKESTVPLASECPTPDSRSGDTREFRTYPFALVLRLRVLQHRNDILNYQSSPVISKKQLVSVRKFSTYEVRSESFKTAPIKTRTLISVKNYKSTSPQPQLQFVSTAASIHTSRGFGGYRPSSCAPESLWSALRFLGPSARIAGLLAVLWGGACSLHAAVLIQAARTLAVTTSASVTPHLDHLTTTTSAIPNLAVLAAVNLALSTLTLIVVLTLLRWRGWGWLGRRGNHNIVRESQSGRLGKKNEKEEEEKEEEKKRMRRRKRRGGEEKKKEKRRRGEEEREEEERRRRKRRGGEEKKKEKRRRGEEEREEEERRRRKRRGGEEKKKERRRRRRRMRRRKRRGGEETEEKNEKEKEKRRRRRKIIMRRRRKRKGRRRGGGGGE